MKPFCFVATCALFIAFGTNISGASETRLIEIGTPPLQSEDRLTAEWNKVSPDRRSEIQSYLLSLGLSSTGRIQLIGSFHQTIPSNDDRSILQFQQIDLQGTRLFWSVLVDPDALEARVIFSLSDKQQSSDFRPISTTQ